MQICILLRTITSCVTVFHAYKTGLKKTSLDDILQPIKNFEENFTHKITEAKKESLIEIRSTVDEATLKSVTDIAKVINDENIAMADELLNSPSLEVIEGIKKRIIEQQAIALKEVQTKKSDSILKYTNTSLEKLLADIKKIIHASCNVLDKKIMQSINEEYERFYLEVKALVEKTDSKGLFDLKYPDAEIILAGIREHYATLYDNFENLITSDIKDICSVVSALNANDLEVSEVIIEKFSASFIEEVKNEIRDTISTDYKKIIESSRDNVITGMKAILNFVQVNILANGVGKSAEKIYESIRTFAEEEGEVQRTEMEKQINKYYDGLVNELVK